MTPESLIIPIVLVNWSTTNSSVIKFCGITQLLDNLFCNKQTSRSHKTKEPYWHMSRGFFSSWLEYISDICLTADVCSAVLLPRGEGPDLELTSLSIGKLDLWAITQRLKWIYCPLICIQIAGNKFIHMHWVFLSYWNTHSHSWWIVPYRAPEPHKILMLACLEKKWKTSRWCHKLDCTHCVRH